MAKKEKLGDASDLVVVSTEVLDGDIVLATYSDGSTLEFAL